VLWTKKAQYRVLLHEFLNNKAGGLYLGPKPAPPPKKKIFPFCICEPFELQFSFLLPFHFNFSSFLLLPVYYFSPEMTSTDVPPGVFPRNKLNYSKNVKSTINKDFFLKK
jgi:hypothetical protein